MTETLPKPVGAFDDDLLRRIAMDVGKEIVAYIDHAYPEMYDGVLSPKSARLSIRNATYNAIMQAVKDADRGRSEAAISANDAHRRTMRRLQRAAKVYRE